MAKEKERNSMAQARMAQAWRVKAHGIQVVKLFCLRGEDFKVLKELRDRFVGRFWGGKKGSFEVKKSGDSKNHRFISPIRDVLSPRIDKASSGYEPTWMFETRDSSLWSWKRTIEYFNQMREVHGLAAN